VADSPIDTPALAPQADKPSPPQQSVPSKAQTSPESSPHKSAESQKSAEPGQSTETHKSAEVGSADQGSAESYVAQVGAYSKPDAAKQELNKLKKWGFKAYIEKSGDKIRVRVGPYVDRAKAEKAAHQLEKHGLHPVIISK
jgi:DedD protein